MTSARLIPICVIASLGVFVACDDESSTPPGAGASSSSSSGSSGVDASSGGPQEAGVPFTPIDGEPGVVWLTSDVDHKLTKVDAQTGAVLADYDVGQQPRALALSGGFVYLRNNDGASAVLGRVDAQGNLTQTAVTQPEQLAVGGGSLWATLTSGDVARIDPSTGNETKRIQLPSPATMAGRIAYMNDAAFVLASSKIVKIPAATDVATDLVDLKDRWPNINPAFTWFTAGEGFVWAFVYAGTSPGSTCYVEKIDPSTGALAGTAAGPCYETGSAFAAGAGTVWLAFTAAATLSRLDVATLQIGKQVNFSSGGATQADIALSPTAVWLSDDINKRLIRVAYATGIPQYVRLPHRPSKIAFETK